MTHSLKNLIQLGGSDIPVSFSAIFFTWGNNFCDLLAVHQTSTENGSTLKGKCMHLDNIFPFTSGA